MTLTPENEALVDRILGPDRADTIEDLNALLDAARADGRAEGRADPRPNGPTNIVEAYRDAVDESEPGAAVFNAIMWAEKWEFEGAKDPWKESQDLTTAMQTSPSGMRHGRRQRSGI
jgi:hypothetical protein